jgi:hypothetical protein
MYFKTLRISWVWWCTPIILVLGRLRWADCEFEASLGNIDSKILPQKVVTKLINK